MRKTKLLNYYDWYLIGENNIDYLLITMEELQITLKDYVEAKYKDDGPGITGIMIHQLYESELFPNATLRNG